MKRMKRYSPVLCMLMVVSLLWTVSGFATESDEATIIGRVQAVAWDDKGNVIDAVFSGTGEEYKIVDNAIGKELFNLDGMLVMATGVVVEDSKGRKSLTVADYDVLGK